MRSRSIPIFKYILLRNSTAGTAVFSSNAVNHTAVCTQDMTNTPWHNISKCQKKLKHGSIFLTENVTRSFYFEVSWSLGGWGRGNCNIQKNFLTYDQIITKLSHSMKATIFSSYPTPPTQTMNKKINLDIIHTLIYISENEVGNQPGNWVLGQWDSWGRKRSHVTRKKHMKTSRLSVKAIIVFGVSQWVNLPAHNLSLLICTSYLTSYF